MYYHQSLEFSTVELNEFEYNDDVGITIRTVLI